MYMYDLQIEDLPSLADSSIEVKLSGDGALFSRVFPYILLFFSFLLLNVKLSSEGEFLFPNDKNIIND